MPRALRPWITAGAALTGASMIAVTPSTNLPGVHDAQQRPVQLKSYAEYDLAQLISATEANLSGLETALSSSHWQTDPDISQGFSTVLSDLSTGTSNPVTNPFSLLVEGTLGLFSAGYADNAATTALTGVSDNVQTALSSGDYSTALSDLENGPTTILSGLFNGYPQTTGSDFISPQFGLFTNTTDGAATGEINALQQISNTLADEFASAGGAHLTTGPLPLTTGNLDLSISLNQVLSDLGLTSGGGPLTINGLLADLHLPSSITIGQILNHLGVSDSSGFTIGQILHDLNVSDSTGISIADVLHALNLTDSSGISLSQALSDLGSGSGISVGQILNDLGYSDSTSIGIPAISVGTILNDLGYSDSTGINIPPISIGTILGDLGYGDSSSISIPPISIPVSQILSQLGLTVNNGDITLSGLSTSISEGTLLSDIGIPTSGSVTVNGIPIIGHASVPVSDLLAALNISTGKDVTVGIPPLNIPLSDLGITNPNGDLTFNVPSINVGDVLTALHLTDSNTITPPSITIGDVLTTLGLNDTNTITPPSITIGDVLNTLNLKDTSTIDLSHVLSALGLSPNDTITLGDVLKFLNLTDSSQAINIGQVLTALGLNDNSQAINIGEALNFLGLSDNTSISFDSILNDLGINPNEDIFSLLGISNPLTLDPTLDLTGGSVPLYDLDLSKDLLAVLGSFAPLSSDVPSLLTTDPTLDLVPLLSGLLSDLGAPAAITGGDLSANLTNLGAELIAGLVP